MFFSCLSRDTDRPAQPRAVLALVLYIFPLEPAGLMSSQRTAHPKEDVRALSDCSVQCQCSAKGGGAVPQVWAQRDRQTLPTGSPAGLFTSY